MTTTRIRIVPAVAAAGLLLLVLGALHPVSSSAQPAAGTPVPGWSTATQTCVQANGRLDVLFMVDESKSLEKSDPTGARVDGLTAALISMAQANAASPTPAEIDVALGGFGVDVHRWVEFTPLTRDSVGGLVAESEGFRLRNQELDTDYFAALQQSQSWLSARAAATSAGSKPACQMIVWFTDGQYDIEDRTGPRTSKLPHSKEPDTSIDLAERGAGDRLETRGRAVLCEPAGIVDQLRVSKIPIVAVGLNTQASPFDDAYLRSLVEGEGCGTEPPLGELKPAGDVDDLIIDLSTVAQTTSGPPPVPLPPTPVCPEDQPSPDCIQRFSIPDAVGRFTILGLPQEGGTSLELQPPGGGPVIRLESGKTGVASASGASISTAWIKERVVVATLTLPQAPALRGDWTASFVSPSPSPGAKARATIQIFASFEIAVTAPATLNGGEQAQFGITVSSPGADNVTPLPLESADVSASIRRDGRSEAVEMDVVAAAAGDYTAGVVVPEEYAGGNLVLEVRVQPHVSAEGGEAFPPSTKTFEFPVTPMAGLPTVVTKRLAFGGIEDEGSATATIEVRGDDNVDGCVEIGRAEFPATIRTAGEPSLEADDGCIDVAAGSTERIEVRLAAGRAADLAVSGEVDVTVKGGSETSTWTLPITAQFDRKVDTFTQTGVAVVLLVAGVLAPLLLMWLVGSLMARFRNPSDLKVAQYDVRITSAGVLGPDGLPLVVDLDPFRPFADSEGNLRSFDVGATDFSARAPRSPFGAASGRASIEGRLSVGPDGSAGADAIVPLALRSSWVLQADPSSIRSTDDLNSGADFSVSGALLLFLSLGAETEGDLAALRRAVAGDVVTAARQLADSFVPDEGDGSDPDATPDGRPDSIFGGSRYDDPFQSAASDRPSLFGD